MTILESMEKITVKLEITRQAALLAGRTERGTIDVPVTPDMIESLEARQEVLGLRGTVEVPSELLAAGGDPTDWLRAIIAARVAVEREETEARERRAREERARDAEAVTRSVTAWEAEYPYAVQPPGDGSALVSPRAEGIACAAMRRLLRDVEVTAWRLRSPLPPYGGDLCVPDERFSGANLGYSAWCDRIAARVEGAEEYRRAAAAHAESFAREEAHARRVRAWASIGANPEQAERAARDLLPEREAAEIEVRYVEGLVPRGWRVEADQADDDFEPGVAPGHLAAFARLRAVKEFDGALGAPRAYGKTETMVALTLRAVDKVDVLRGTWALVAAPEQDD